MNTQTETNAPAQAPVTEAPVTEAPAPNKTKVMPDNEFRLRGELKTAENAVKAHAKTVELLVKAAPDMFPDVKKVEEKDRYSYLMHGHYSAMWAETQRLDKIVSDLLTTIRNEKVEAVYTVLKGNLEGLMPQVCSNLSELQADAEITLKVIWKEGQPQTSVIIKGSRSASTSSAPSTSTGKRGKSVWIDEVEYESGSAALDALIQQLGLPSDYGAGSNKVMTAERLCKKHKIEFKREQ